MTLGIKADLEAAVHRAEAWCGEPLLHEGENADVALASGTARRAALDAALEEMSRGATEPSYGWRRDYALILGLERVLNDPQPKLASGTTLRRHQIDALAGQLAALISDIERGEPDEDDDEDDNGNGNGSVEEDLPEADGFDVAVAHVTEPIEPDAEGEERLPDPGARRRYRFKHPTASGKTIAAAG